MFESIKDKEFSEKNMFCNGLICLNRNTKWNIFCPKVLYLVVLDKILFVFSTDAKRLVLNWLLDSFHIFVEENTKLRKVSASSKWLYKKVEMFQEPDISWKKFINPKIHFKILARKWYFLQESCIFLQEYCIFLQEIFQGSWKFCLTE